MRRLLRAAVAGAALATAAGEAERVWWPLGIPASFRPQLAAVLGAGGGALARSGSPALALAGAAGLLANVARIAPLYRSPGTGPAGPERLRVAHWNVNFANRRHDLVAGALCRLDADVVFLLEARPPWERRLRAAGLPFAIAGVGGQDPILVLTRSPLPVHVVPLPAGRAAAEVRVELGGRTVRVLGLHAHSPHTGRYKAGRDAQLRALAAVARATADPLVAVGDLNTVPWSRAFRDLVRDGGLVDSERGFGAQPSWPAYPWTRWLGVPIDHALHTPDLVTVARATGPSGGSDHRLLRVTVAPSSGSRCARSARRSRTRCRA